MPKYILREKTEPFFCNSIYAKNSGCSALPSFAAHAQAHVSYLGSKKEHLIGYMLSFAGYNSQCDTREDVRIVSLPWCEVTTIKQSYWCKRTATSIHSLTLRNRKNDTLWIVELPFRGHTRDQDKCPLNRVALSLEVTGTTIRQGNPDFSRHLGKSKLVRVIRRFEKSQCWLVCEVQPVYRRPPAPPSE